MTDPAMYDLRRAARSAVAAETVARIVHRHAERFGLDASSVLATVDWDATLAVGRYGQVREKAVKRLLRACAQWQAAQV